MLTGIALILLGTMLALRQAGLITWFSMANVWPLLLIAIGLKLIVRPGSRRCSVRTRESEVVQ